MNLNRNSKSAKEQTLNKLGETAGFTLAEQLLSALLIGLLSIAVATGLGVATRVYGAVSLEAGANQLMMRAVQEINDELAYAVLVSSDGRNYLSATTRTIVHLENSSNNQGISMTGVGLGGSLTADEKSIVLIPRSAELNIRFDIVPSYSKSSNAWTYTISVSKDDGAVLEQESMKVTRNVGPS